MINTSKSQSFFLFGARGTGKSTYLRNHFSQNAFYINLLEETAFLRYGRNADLLIADLKNIPKLHDVIIDEIQKLPRLLDVIHHLIETEKRRFILTGSSARKLKRGHANLLAGRAFHYYLYPMTSWELDSEFDLSLILKWGSLPRIFSLSDEDKEEFLRSYALTYLKEEILEEQIVRNGISFRNYLEVAAQENGKTINFSKIARDVNVDTKTIQNYFQILEDTMLGFFLPAFHQSIRKSVKLQPKFYLFDLGVKRALALELKSDLVPRTSSYGFAFEHFLIAEIFRINSYTRSDFNLFHYQTTSGGEIDLVLKRGKEIIAVEIKSSNHPDMVEVAKLKKVAADIGAQKVFYVSLDQNSSTINGVNCIHWLQLLNILFKSARS